MRFSFSVVGETAIISGTMELDNGEWRMHCSAHGNAGLVYEMRKVLAGGLRHWNKRSCQHPNDGPFTSIHESISQRDLVQSPFITDQEVVADLVRRQRELKPILSPLKVGEPFKRLITVDERFQAMELAIVALGADASEATALQSMYVAILQSVFRDPTESVPDKQPASNQPASDDAGDAEQPQKWLDEVQSHIDAIRAVAASNLPRTYTDMTVATAWLCDLRDEINTLILTRSKQ